MELRDQDVPKETRQEFEKLKEDYPEVFSLNNQDIGRTQLVTMHVDTGDSPPICQKPYTLPLKALQLGTTGDQDLRASRHHQERVSVHGPVQLLLFPRNLDLVNPPGGECVLISEK